MEVPPHKLPDLLVKVIQVIAFLTKVVALIWFLMLIKSPLTLPRAFATISDIDASRLAQGSSPCRSSHRDHRARLLLLVKAGP